MFKIANTNKELKQVALFWQEARELAAKIKDEYDLIEDNKFHSKFYKRHSDYVRPDFFEPIKKPNKNINSLLNENKL